MSDQINEQCECCDRPAHGYDEAGTPLCNRCGKTLEREKKIDAKIDEIVDNVYPLPENGLRSDMESRVESRNKLVNALDELLRIAGGSEEL